MLNIISTGPGVVGPLDQLVRELQRARHFRPTAVLIIENPEGRILTIKNKYLDRWDLPQGGVEDGRGLIPTCFDEGREEVGMPREAVISINFLGQSRAIIPNWYRDGYDLGKMYFFFHVLAHEFEVVLEPLFSKYGWFKFPETCRRIQLTNSDKWPHFERALYMARGTAPGLH